MTVTSYGHYPASGTWNTNKKLEGEADMKAKANSHAEILVFKKLDQSRDETVYLITQNAFPCDKCHAWFKKHIGTKSVIIKVEDDQGSYSMYHAMTAPIAYPQYFFYRGGTATQNATGAAPAGFPATPALPGPSYYY